MVLAAGLLAGCASAPTLSPSLRGGDKVELSGTPFFPQREYQCGPAALATGLGASGVDVTPDQLAPAVYVPGRKGSLQAELMAAARRHQRVPVPVEGRLEVLLQHLRDGRPVLVLLNLGVSWLPVWHYAVVVGYEPDAARFILRSGAEARALMPAARLQRAWAYSKHWGIVITPADAIPAASTETAWLTAVAPFESLAQLDAAELAYRAAIQRWPESAPAWTAQGNLHARRQRWPAAVSAYSEALRRQDGVIVRNNRADALGRLQCVVLAEQDLQRAAELDAGARFAGPLRRTRAGLPAVDRCPAEIAAMLGSGA